MGQHTGSLTRPGWCLQRPPRPPSSRYLQLSIRRFPSCKAPILRGHQACGGQTPRDTTETVGRELSRPPLPSTSPNSRARRRGGGSHPQTRPARVAGLFFPSRFAKPPCLWPVTGLAQGLGSFHSRAPRRPVMADEGADRSRKGGEAGHSDISRVMVEPVLLSLPFPDSSWWHLTPPPAWALVW